MATSFRASNWLTLSLTTASRVHPFCNLQSWAQTHAVLVIGLYELLGNPTSQLIELPGPLTTIFGGHMCEHCVSLQFLLG
jgi:hypothetical protein